MIKVMFNKPMLYKELASMFNLEFKEGGYRKRQLEKLMREFEILKYGKHYVVTKEFTQVEKMIATPRITIKDYIVPLVYTYMHNGKYNGEIIKTKGNILKDLSIINDNFYVVKADPSKYAILLDESLEVYNLMKYTETTYKMFCNILDDALEDLFDRRLSFVSKIKMTLKVFECKNGDVIKKAIPLTDLQIKAYTTVQNEYINTHFHEDGEIYRLWSRIPYKDLKRANQWVTKKLGYQTFDGYKLLLNEKGIEKYMAQNLPEMQHALLDLVEQKIVTTTRKGMVEIPKETRHKLAKELNSSRNTLTFNKKKE